MRISNMTMTPIQIASSVIEKLQEENRISLETLHRTQNEIKHLQRQLLEKEQLIKILEDRLRSGSNSFLEISNRQKEITIKHLELQIQKLLKENQELDNQISSVKSDICAKCETKFLLGSEGKRTVSRPLVKKSTLKDLPSKNAPSHDSQNREKMLERIIEHKDKRILHLSKEVQKLSQVEKELTNKIYRLTKLLPMSQMPSEMLIECLLNEIKSLESQMQLNRSIDNSTLKPKLCVKGVSILPSNSNPSMKSEKLKICSEKNHAVSDFGSTERENVTLVSTLHKLFNDVSELKQFFASENEKMHQNLTRNSLKNDTLKIQWKEIISRVNDIAESINNIIKTSPGIKNCDSSNSMEKESIQRLQDMLKNSLELTSQYEEENAVLKANLEKLNEQLMLEQENLQCAETKIRLRSEELSRLEQNLDFCQDVSELQHFKELLKDKQQQLDSAEKHLKTCQILIEELQKLSKGNSLKETLRINSKDRQDSTDAIPSANVLQFRSLEKKLEVAEKNIKTCEEVIEELQIVIRNLEEENLKLDSDLHMAKLNKVVSDANNNHYIALKTKLDVTEDQLTTVTNLNKELQDKLVSLEEENTNLRADLLRTSSRDASLQDNDEKISLQNKLDAAEQTTGVLENNIIKLQTSVEKLKDENKELRMKLQSSVNNQNVIQTCEDDVISLRNELILKEEEIQGLKESLHAFERKAFEMNHYRKTLRQEIEKLCDALTENADSSTTTASRKAIYNAAVFHSAQAILRLDADLNVQPEPAEHTNALEEMKNQVSVYLTEVARIHELLTLKEQQREELLKQYLDLNNQIDFAGTSSHELFVKEQPESNVKSHAPVILTSRAVIDTSSGTTVSIPSDGETNTQSGSATNALFDAKISPVNTSSESGVHSANKKAQTVKLVAPKSLEAEVILSRTQEELEASKSITTYLLSKCAELEDLLEKERIKLSKCQSENETKFEVIESLKNQLNVKSNLTKRLNTLIDMMRSRECNDDITMEQMKSEVKWLVNENQKVFEKITNTQSELCRCKEENSRIQNDLDSMKRELVNEKYENAKVNNELKHLRNQLTHSQSSIDHDT